MKPAPLPLLAAALLIPLFAPRPAAAQPRFEVHGFTELQVRALSDGFRAENWYLSQLAPVLNLEVEVDLAPDGFGPFELMQLFGRVEARYECVYTGCGAVPSWRLFGDRATVAPRNLTDGREDPYRGVLRLGDNAHIHRDHELLPLTSVPPFDRLTALGSTNLDTTFGPVLDARFAVKKIDATLGPGVLPNGPWLPTNDIEPLGSLRTVPNVTLPLPLRPPVPDVGGAREPHGLYVPSFDLRRRLGDLDDFDQNFSEADLAWNHGGGQDERELKELYLDVEMLEGRLWMRLGKQSIVWGKTELFRTTDQFNPQDLALSSLPTLEESRLSLWSARAVYSLYDVGPLEDVRLEAAVNFDDFEPLDLGRCGEPYTIFLVCAKTFGLWSHGLSGLGIAGEERPPDPWNDASGLEFGARVEFRWNRFSFQISDFYGYDDAPYFDFFGGYERNVDPLTGRPLDVLGRPLVPGAPDDEVLALHPANRQLFDLACSATVGIAGNFIPELEGRCLVDLPNDQNPVLPLTLTAAQALGVVLGGSGNGEAVASLLAGASGTPVSVDLAPLNDDVNDGGSNGFFAGIGALAEFLTDEQEALVGCGDFYGTDCDLQGIDLFNAEASVLFQSFPQFEPGGAVATRPVDGMALILPGARGPGDPGYTPLVDGCTGPDDDPLCDGRMELTDPITGDRFRNEMGAVSFNFMMLLAALDAAQNPGECDVTDPVTCSLVQDVFRVAGITRPEVRAGGNGSFGRRDFIWHGGAEILVRYEKRNVLGFAFDFAEDVTKSNWSLEATWVDDQPYAVTDKPRHVSRRDTYNLTISVDRPTFINFLNPNRTFFFNSQWFIRYISDYDGGGDFSADGPVSVLGTATVVTGYFQDRLLPSLTWVHDFSSASGGAIWQASYRFTENFSATVGTAVFYGGPERLPVSVREPLAQNNGGNFVYRRRYNGLVPIAERDEVFLRLRYTF